VQVIAAMYGRLTLQALAMCKFLHLPWQCASAMASFDLNGWNCNEDVVATAHPEHDGVGEFHVHMQDLAHPDAGVGILKAKTCQSTCNADFTCDIITWTKDGNMSADPKVLPGSCWTLNRMAEIQPMKGFVTCYNPKVNWNMSSSNTSVDQAKSTTLSAPAFNTTMAPSIDWGEGDGGEGDGGKGGMPWWGWLFIALVAVCIGALILCCACASGNTKPKKKKTKRAAKAKPAQLEESARVLEATPLVAAQSENPVNTTVSTSPTVPSMTVPVTAVQPLTYVAPMSVTTYTAAHQMALAPQQARVIQVASLATYTMG